MMMSHDLEEGLRAGSMWRYAMFIVCRCVDVPRKVRCVSSSFVYKPKAGSLL